MAEKKKVVTKKKPTPKKKVAAKKPVSKKATSKKKVPAKKVTKQKVIALKQVGRNVSIIIDKKPYSRAIADKEEREELKALVEKYNKSNTTKGEKDILKIITKGKTTEKERVNKAKKSSPKKVKEKVVKDSPKIKKVSKTDAIAAAQKLLKNEGFEVFKKAPASHSGRRREY